MKRKCKNIDISDVEYIKQCIARCMSNKPLRAWERPDVVRLLEKYGDVDAIAKHMSETIKAHADLGLPPVRHETRIDRGSGKERVLSIEDIEQQFYDYVAHDALDDLATCIGEFQYGVRKGTGCQKGVKIIRQWLHRYPEIKYVVKADIKKCYPSIKRENMMAYLRRHVKNDDLLRLIDKLLEMDGDIGLPIGSYLSIRLAGIYLSQLYHFIAESQFKYRRGKTINMVVRVMFYLDDIYIFGSSSRDLHKVMQNVEGYADTLGLHIKGTWQIISLSHKDRNAHLDAMGYRIYRDRVTMRHRNYIALKRAIAAFKNHPDVRTAQALISLIGMNIKHTNSLRFIQKYNVYKHYRLARRIVSEYDKRNFRHQTREGADYRNLRQSVCSTPSQP